MSTPLKALINRFTPTARRTVEEAASRALSRSHFEIEIEHVVLALLSQDDNAGVAALRSLGSNIEQIERRNEVGQIELLAGFIQNNATLWKAVKEKEWHLIAYNYNGPNYKSDTAYDVKMKEAYEYYCKNSA